MSTSYNSGNKLAYEGEDDDYESSDKSSSGRLHLYFTVKSPEDEILAEFCRNPGRPHRKTSNLVRLALETLYLPIAAKNAGWNEEQVQELALESLEKLEACRQELARKCGIKLP